MSTRPDRSPPQAASKPRSPGFAATASGKSGPVSAGTTTLAHTRARVGRLDVSVHTVPTDGHEADGTLDWDVTTAVVVRAAAGGETGLGYTYTDAAAADIVTSRLGPLVEGRDPLAVRAAWDDMVRSVRN